MNPAKQEQLSCPGLLDGLTESELKELAQTPNVIERFESELNELEKQYKKANEKFKDLPDLLKG